VLKRDKKKKGEDNYQDSVTAPIDRTFDDDAIGQEEDEEGQDEEDSSQMLLGVLSAIEASHAFTTAVGVGDILMRAYVAVRVSGSESHGL